MKKDKKGFTLLELLIVIAILAVLGAMVIFLLNPAETLRKARDSQRISDLSTIKTAVGIYLASRKTPQLDGAETGTYNDKCDGGTAANERLWVSVASSSEAITDATPPSGWTQAVTSWGQSTTIASSTQVDGTGWMPIKLTALSGGSPISNFPIDPTNDVITVSSVSTTDLMYRYACKKSPLGFEINAKLESDAYTLSTEEDLAAKDGGNNTVLYEVGTDLTILPDASVGF